MLTETQAQAYVDDLMAQAVQRAAQASAMAQELESLTVRAASGDGRCEVAVGQGGALVDLWLSPDLARATLGDLRRQVLEADAAARRAMSDEIASLAAAHYGAGSATAEEIAGRFARLLVPAAPADEADTAATSRRPGVVR